MKPTTSIFNFVIPEAVRFSPPVLNDLSFMAQSILNNPVTPYQPKLGRVIVVYPMDRNYSGEYSAYDNQIDSQAERTIAIGQQETDFSLSDPSNFGLNEMHSRNHTDSSEEIMMADENNPLFDPTEIYSQNYTDSDEEIIMEDEPIKIDISSSGENKALEWPTIKSWSQEDNQRLREKVQNISKKRLGRNAWKTIAQDFPGKTHLQVKNHYQNLKLNNKEGIIKGKWLQTENQRLKEIITEHGYKPETFTRNDWKQIASQMKSRNWVQIRTHWTQIINPIVKKSEWTKEEDEIIMEKIQEVGKRWVLIAKALTGRTAHQVKQHYTDALNSQIRKQDWTEKEDQLLKDGFANLGSRWQKIAEYINQQMGLETIRTRTQCANRWRVISRAFARV